MNREIINKVSNKLSENNYKMTSQRRDILKVLIENESKHFSAEELYNAVKEINPNVGLATIYRSLELLHGLGIVQELDFDHNYRRYELSLDDEHHHHLICVKCEKIIEFNDLVLEGFEANLEKEYQFKIIDHQIKFYGYCQECLRDNAKQKTK